jgi:homoserine dehydrogenase
MKHKLALLGFGTVGQGLCEILIDKTEYLKNNYDFEWEVVAVSDFQKGSVYSPGGLEVKQLLDLAGAGRSIEEYKVSGGQEVETGWDALKTVRECNADIMCEMTYTDIKTGQPASDHCRAAFESGKHVVTSNKGPTALNYRELTGLAAKNGVSFMIEGTVMSGTPVLNLARNELAGNEITAIRGILNGTTNFILTNMEAGRPYDEVLAEAQKLGYAEADPTADVEGFDALAKVTILANVIMGESLTPDQIPCKGISQITLDDIEEARSEGKRWKLIGEIKREAGNVSASVAPMKIDQSHPLAGVGGAVNAITFSTDLMGDVTMTGAGAGRIETGFSMLVDVLEIHRNTKGVTL